MKINLKLTLILLLMLLPLTVSATAIHELSVEWKWKNQKSLHIGEIMDCTILITNNQLEEITVTSILYHTVWMQENSFVIISYNTKLKNDKNIFNFQFEVPPEAKLGLSSDYGCIVKFVTENGTSFDSQIIRPSPITIEKGISIYETQTVEFSFVGLILFFSVVGLLTILLFKRNIFRLLGKNKKYIPIVLFLSVFIVYAFAVNSNFFSFGISKPLQQGFSITGDEPHYIVVIKSILKGTFNISKVYSDGTVQHSRISTGFLLSGTPITTHSLGVPVLGIIPYIIGQMITGSGVYGVLLMTSVFVAGISVLIYKLGMFLVKDLWISLLVAITFAFSTLLFPWSGQIFGAGILAFFIFFVIYKTFTAKSKFDWVISAIVLGLLTFIKRNIIFLSILSVILISVYLYRNKQTKNLKYFLLAFLVCLIPVFVYEVGIVGFGTIPFVGNIDVMSVPETYNIIGIHISQRFWLGLFGHWIDANSGILWYSPILILSFLGMYQTVKLNRKFFWVFPLSLFMFWYLSTGVVGYWHGWLAPPGRYIIPILPLMSIPLLYAVKEFKNNRLFHLSYLLLFLFGLFSNILLATNRILGYVVVWVNGVPKNWFWLALGKTFNFNVLELPEFAYAWLIGGRIGNIPQPTLILVIWCLLFLGILTSLITISLRRCYNGK